MDSLYIDDPNWKTTVDQFLLSASAQATYATGLADVLPSLLNHADFCLNR
jgi:hypothetical protein